MVAGDVGWTGGKSPPITGLEVTMDQLPNWLGRTGLEFSIESADPRMERVAAMHATLRPVEEEWSTFESFDVGVGHAGGFKEDGTSSITLTNSPSLLVKYHEAYDLRPIIADAHLLQDLVTLTADAVASLERLTVTTLAFETEGEASVEHRLNVYIQQDIAAAARPKMSGQMLLTFEALGGLAAIGNWLRQTADRRPVLGPLLSIKYGLRMYDENRFQNVLSAAESLHRIKHANHVQPPEEFKRRVRSIVDSAPATDQDWLRQQLQFANEPRLKHRLGQLASEAGPTFAGLVGDLPAWCRVVAAVRNRLTHWDGRRKDVAQGDELYWLTESVYVLVMLVLVSENADDPGVVAKLSQNPRLAYVARKIPKIVRRLDPVLTGRKVPKAD